MTTTETVFRPDYAIHPGEYLEEILEARGIRQRELADRMGVSENFLSHLLHGTKPVGPDTALKLERALGISSAVWNNLNAAFRLHEARECEKACFQKKKEWARGFPLGWLRTQGFLPAACPAPDVVPTLLGFFRFSTPEALDTYTEKLGAAFRKSDVFTTHPKASAAWLRAGELLAESIETAPFQKPLFRASLDQIRALTTHTFDEAKHRMTELCRAAGVALVFLPTPPKMPVYGATRWLREDKALIMLSLRQKSDDQFWFSFFHEAGHILLHGKKQLFLDDQKPELNEPEEEANRFARAQLVPEKAYAAFVQQKRFTRAAILAFADSQCLAPGIIVGFLQHDKMIPYRFHNVLKRFFRE